MPDARPNANTEPDFGDWSARIGQGDRSAEEPLVYFFRPRVYTFAERNLRDAEAAEEIAQETLWAVVLSLRAGKLNDPRELPAYVFGIARNKLADCRRRAARRRVEPWPRDFDPPSFPNEAEAEAERHRMAKEAIGELETVDRTVLTLLLSEGLGPAVIADRLGISQEAVRQRKSRALKRLAQRMRNIASSPSRLRAVERTNHMQGKA